MTRATRSGCRFTQRSPTPSPRPAPASAHGRLHDAVEKLRDLPAGTRLLWALSGCAEYPVWIGRGLLGSGLLASPAQPASPGSLARRFCVTDENVAPLWLGAAGDFAASIVIAAGEPSKSLAQAERIWRELAQRGMTRADHLVALGGGVVGDLAGFCAGAYQRGVAVIQVPTTLAAQVDSAYGGKTGVDLPEGKNYVGVYHHPSAVLVDPATLRPCRRRSGARGTLRSSRQRSSPGEHFGSGSPPIGQSTTT